MRGEMRGEMPGEMRGVMRGAMRGAMRGETDERREKRAPVGGESARRGGGGTITCSETRLDASRTSAVPRSRSSDRYAISRDMAAPPPSLPPPPPAPPPPPPPPAPPATPPPPGESTKESATLETRAASCIWTGSCADASCRSTSSTVSVPVPRSYGLAPWPRSRSSVRRTRRSGPPTPSPPPWRRDRCRACHAALNACFITTPAPPPPPPPPPPSSPSPSCGHEMRGDMRGDMRGEMRGETRGEMEEER